MRFTSQTSRHHHETPSQPDPDPANPYKSAVQHPERQVRDLLTEMLAEAGASGAVRNDMPAQELASFCTHALTAATDLTAAPPVEGLVDLVWVPAPPALPGCSLPGWWNRSWMDQQDVEAVVAFV